MGGYVYFMANERNTTLYVGVTGNIEKRAWEHKTGTDKSSFTYRYNCFKLVYVENYSNIRDAIEREKQLKNWKREWKNELISKVNPGWHDLSLMDGIAGQVRNDEGQGCNDEGQGCNDEGQGCNDEGQGCNDEGQGCNDEGQGCNDEGQGCNDERN